MLMWWPFKSNSNTQKKSFSEIAFPDKNALLKALFEYQARSGTAFVMQDNPTAYIEQGYSGNADVYSIINKIVRMAGQARLALYTTAKNGKWEEVTDSELNKFLRSVNPTMKTADFIAGHLIYKLSIGNSYWYKPTLQAGLNKGKAIELWLLPSNNVEIVSTSSWMNPIAGYRLEGRTKAEFEPQEVYHSKFFNPLFGDVDTLYGQSPLKAAAETVSKQNQAELTELKQFENQSPPYLLYRDVADISGVMNGLTPEQRQQIQDLFKEYPEKFKQGLPMVLPDKFGMLNLGVSPVDLNILQSSQEGRRILCNIYGLPSELFNDKASSTYNNIVEAKKSAWTDCIIPNLNDFATSLTNFLIDPVQEYSSKGLFFAFDYNEVQELQKDRAQMVTWMRQAYWTPNEIREATGADPYDNEAMNEPWIGMGEMPISQATVQDTLPSEDLKDFGDYTGKRNIVK